MRPSWAFLVAGAIVTLIVLLFVGYYNILAPRTLESEAAMAANAAVEFVRAAPTFKWDGVDDSLKLLSTNKIAEGTFEVKIAFTSTHGGYGDRTGKIITQVVTEHDALVVVEKGKVVSAVLDGRWDELNQKPKV